MKSMNDDLQHLLISANKAAKAFHEALRLQKEFNNSLCVYLQEQGIIQYNGELTIVDIDPFSLDIYCDYIEHSESGIITEEQLIEIIDEIRLDENKVI